jgi:hypothetical protein
MFGSADRTWHINLKSLRERWSDPLLTGLTILLALLIFVVAPLEAAGIAQAQDVGFAISVIVISAIVILSGKLRAIALMVVALGLAVTAAVLRYSCHRYSTSISRRQLGYWRA